MSDHDDPGFDAERLRAVDRPIPPSTEGDARIRADMLAAFDQVSSHGDDTVERDTDVADIGTLRVVEDDQPDTEARRTPRARRWGRGMFWAAAAAAVTIVAVASLATRGGDGTTDVAEQNAAAVAVFCSDIEADVVTVEAFLSAPGGERDTRAMRALELSTQSYVDVTDALVVDEIVALRSLAGELAAEAAAIRSGSVQSGAPDAERLRALAAALGDAIDRLPGAGECGTERLRGDS